MSGVDVSVVIPTYNRKDYLQRAVASCFEGNEEIDVEVVVVDDGSSDGTREWLRNLNHDQVRPIFQGNHGAPVARNRGLEEAKGQFLKFLDDDDWLAEGALVEEVKTLEKATAEMSYAAYERVDDNGTTVRRVGAPRIDDIVSALLRGTVLTHPHRFTYRHELISNLEWNTNLPCRQDVDFALTVATQDPSFVRVDRVAGYLRQHEGERISTGAASSSSGRVHAGVLLHGVKDMEKKGILTEQRKWAAAEGLWQWAHLVAGQNLQFFDSLYEEIKHLVPVFTPNRKSWILSQVDRVVGPRMTEYLTYPARKLKYEFSDT